MRIAKKRSEPRREKKPCFPVIITVGFTRGVCICISFDFDLRFEGWFDSIRVKKQIEMMGSLFTGKSVM